MGPRRARRRGGGARDHRLDRPPGPRRGARRRPREREADFLRAAADWTWETDDTLRLTALSPGAAAAIGRAPAEFIGKQLTRLFRFRESARRRAADPDRARRAQGFDDQSAELRGGRKGRYRLSGVPLIDGAGRFAGFRGAAVGRGRSAGRGAPRPRRDGSAFGERLDAGACAARSPTSSTMPSASAPRARARCAATMPAMPATSPPPAATCSLWSTIWSTCRRSSGPISGPSAEAIDLADVARRAAGLLAVRAADARRHASTRPAPTRPCPRPATSPARCRC